MFVWKKHKVCNLQILQTDYLENILKKEKIKIHVLLENNQTASMSCQKKKYRQNYLSLNIIKCLIYEIELKLWI